MNEPVGVRLQSGDWAEWGAIAGDIRRAVFIVEQGIPERLEWDEFDPVAVHCVAFIGDKPIGTGRLLPDAHIGRMAVLREHRDNGVGTAILRRLLEVGRARGERRFQLNAQRYVKEFYEREGFKTYGRPFKEAGIDHVAMRLELD